jgi:hypothetical protein
MGITVGDFPRRKQLVSLALELSNCGVETLDVGMLISTTILT